MRICAYLVSLSLVLSPIHAVAQHAGNSNDRPRLVISDKALGEALQRHFAGPRLIIPANAFTNAIEDTQAPRAARDPLNNGAIIGAVVGAALMAGLSIYACNVFGDDSDPEPFPQPTGSGIPVVWTSTSSGCLAGSAVLITIGFGAGAAAGAGIDALFAKDVWRSRK